MKRSTKRVVGWGAGVAIGVCLVLLSFILVVGMTNGKGGIESDDDLKLDVVEAQTREGPSRAR